MLPWRLADIVEVDGTLRAGNDDEPLAVVEEVRDEGKKDIGLLGRTGVVGMNINCWLPGESGVNPDVSPENGIAPGNPGLGRLGSLYGSGELRMGPVGREGLKYEDATLEEVDVEAPVTEETPGFKRESIANPKACDLPTPNGDAIGGSPKELLR